MNTAVPPVLCIPRVFDDVSDTDKYNTFKRAFVYYKTWNHHSETAKQAMERFEGGNDIKIIYNHPWFWKVSVSTCVSQGRKAKDIYIKK